MIPAVRAALLTLAVALSGCGGGSAGDQRAADTAPVATPSSATSSTAAPAVAPTTAPTPVDPAAAWSELSGRLGARAASRVITVDRDAWAVSAEERLASVWRFDEGAWVRVDTVALPRPVAADSTTTDLTGDGQPEVVLPLGPPAGGVVLALRDDGWAPLPFLLDDVPRTDVDELRLRGPEVLSTVRVCVPNCGDGSIDELVWRYDVARGAFTLRSRVEVVPAVDQPLAPGFTPGQPCAPGSNPDCIDPDGDGAGTYLIGGAACTGAGGPCDDLDGDGRAGDPDSG